MSKLTVRLYRCVEFATDALVTPATGQTAQAAIQAHLAGQGPAAPGFRVFGRPGVSVAAMEAASFIVTEAHVPQAGIVQSDPLIPEHVERIDGALRSELMRLGVYTDCESYQWRFYYEVEGN